MAPVYLGTRNLTVILILPLIAVLLSGNSHAIGWVGTDLNGIPCKGIPQGRFDGLDYTDPAQRAIKLKVVEKNHFLPQVEQLQKGMTSSLFNDIYFVLRVYPNHFRALASMMELQLRNREKKYEVPMECFFQRAIAMTRTSHKGRLYLMYGVYLHRLGKLEDALKVYTEGEKLQPNSSQLLYNMVLLYTDMGDYETAAKYAKRAYQKGFPLPGLRNRLKKNGIAF